MAKQTAAIPLFDSQAKQVLLGEIVSLGPRDLDVFLALQQKAVDHLESPELYAPLTPEEAAQVLHTGHSLGVLVDGELIAFRIVARPGNHEDNLGRDINLSAIDLGKVVHLEASVVLPRFRGNRLQKQLTVKLLEQFATDESIRYIMSTVSNLNAASIFDKFHARLQIVRLKRKYGGYWRYVFFRDMAQTPILPSRIESCLATDVQEQTKLLNSGWSGVGAERSGSELYISYGCNES